MRKPVYCIGFILIATHLSLACSTDEPAPSREKPDFAELIRRLSAEDHETREAATVALLDNGTGLLWDEMDRSQTLLIEKLLKPLRVVADGGDPETSKRARK